MSATARRNGKPAGHAGADDPPILREALRVLDLGLWPIPITPPNRNRRGPKSAGKAPIGKGWGAEPPTAEGLRKTYHEHRDAGLGLRLGPKGGVIDVDIDANSDADREAAEAALDRLMGSKEWVSLGWSSGRGGHYLFRWDDRLRDFPAIVKLGALELRFNGNDSQKQSVIPPSPTTDKDGNPTGERRWNVPDPGPDSIARLPDEFFDRLRAMLAEQEAARKAARPKSRPSRVARAAEPSDTDRLAEVRSALGSITHRAVDHEEWIEVGMALSELGDDGLDLWDQWSQSSDKYQPGECEKRWRSFKPDGEITLRTIFHHAKQAGWKAPRSERPERKTRAKARPEPSSNGKGPVHPIATESTPDDRPKHLANYVGAGDERRFLRAGEILDRLREITGGWPRRTSDGLLFYPERDSGGVRPGFLTSPAQVFAYLARYGQTAWGRGDMAVSREVFHEYLRQNSESFDSIQAAPHWPAIPGVYYLHDPIPDGGATGALDEYLDFYEYASDGDRELFRAFIATAYWGGPPGGRPAFVLTTEEDAAEGGVGYGKSTASNAPALGSPEFVVSASRSSDIDSIKTRLLSSEGMRARIVRFDNIKSLRLSSEDLESLVTDNIISGHRMYMGEGSIPNHYTWVLTINDPALSRDMARRSVPIRMGRARYSGDWSSRVADFLRERRGDVLRDIRGLLNSPAPDGYRVRSRWATWEAQVLSKCRNPEGARDRFLSAQDALNEDAREAESVRDRFMNELAWLGGAEELDPSTIRAAIPAPIAADWLNRALRRTWADAAASRRLRALRIPELQSDRSREGRGYIWTGANWNGESTYKLRKEKGQIIYSVSDTSGVTGKPTF